MTDALLIVMDRSIVGTVIRLNGGRLRFDYADDYRVPLNRAGATPISLSMPTQVRSHPDSAITPWLWGSCPTTTWFWPGGLESSTFRRHLRSPSSRLR